jgi:hypothetical protein
MAAARPHEPPWREPMLEVERILMVDFTATQARAKGVTPSANHEGGGQTEVTVAKTPSALPPPYANGVDRMHHQLAEIRTIVAMQLAECAC